MVLNKRKFQKWKLGIGTSEMEIVAISYFL
jgi:hypothetical protein